MADLEALVTDLAGQMAELVAKLERDFTARLEAASVKGGMIDQRGGLVLTFGDGSSHCVGQVVGRDGVDGTNGAPGAAGLGFEDLDVSIGEDGRTLEIRFERGEVAETFELELPVMIYRGVFDPDRGYRPGDCVSYGGSAWVCSGANTSARPGEGDGWTLAVKRGRDGDRASPGRAA
jgi:integrin beta 3